MLVDVFSKGITGKAAEAALGKAGITVNKNAIPFDQNPPMVASGIRVGTPAITSRGMREPEMDRDRASSSRARSRRPRTTRALGRVKGEVEALCRKFPLYPEVQELSRRRRRRLRARRPAVDRARRLRGAPRASSRWPRPWRTSSPTAACCSPKPAPAPARPSPTSSPRSSAAQRVLVSTGTKNLQEQIFFKDLPVLQRHARHPVHRRPT